MYGVVDLVGECAAPAGGGQDAGLIGTKKLRTIGAEQSIAAGARAFRTLSGAPGSA